MIHYNIWFDLRKEADSAKDLGIVREFLRELYTAGAIADFRMLENSGTAAKTKMLRYQALIEFSDDKQFSTAFSAQAARGIHTGLHGRVMALASDFRVEVFRQIAASNDAAVSELPSQYACEI